MPTIHHSIVKAADKQGIALSMRDEEAVEARFVVHNIVVALDTEGLEEDDTVGLNDLAKDAVVIVTGIHEYQTEHPQIAIRQEDGDFVGYLRKGKGLGDEIARDPEFEDLIVSLDEYLAGDGAEVEGDEEKETGTVVPDRYKKEYAARGNPNHCGDWLAETLASLCRVLDTNGKEITDLDRLEAIANANDVAPARYGKLGVETNGWQGRFRMTIRNMLVPRIAAKGFLFVPEGCGSDVDKEFPAPEAWIAAHAKKPVTAKQAQKEGGVQKNPGQGKASAKTKAKKGDAGVAAASAAIKAAAAKQAKPATA